MQFKAPARLPASGSRDRRRAAVRAKARRVAGRTRSGRGFHPCADRGPDRCRHSRLGSVFTDGRLAHAGLEVLKPLVIGENALEPERVAEKLTRTPSGWAREAR